MRLVCLIAFLVCGFAQQPPSAQQPPAPLPAAAPKPDKLVIRQQISDLKVKSFELQQQVEMLERQLKDVEESEANQSAAALATSKQAPLKTRCSGHTKDGKRCTRMAETGSRFCWQHKSHR